MKTKLMSCLFCVGVGLVPSMASSMNEEVQRKNIQANGGGMYFRIVLLMGLR